MSTKRWWVGPPDPNSKIAPIKFEPIELEHQNVKLERLFRRKSVELYKWHHEFWSKHNKAFEDEKKKYEEQLMTEKQLQKHEITPQHLSAFYKNFLDSRHKLHWDYNWLWYRKNFELVWISTKVHYFRFLRKFVK